MKDLENMLIKGILPPWIEKVKDNIENNINIFPIIEPNYSINIKLGISKNNFLD